MLREKEHQILDSRFLKILSWPPTSRLARSALSASASSLNAVPAFHVLSPVTTLSPIMINDLEPQTSPSAPSSLLPFLCFLQHLVGTESMRGRRRRGLGWLVGWRTGGAQPEVGYRTRHHINQCDVFTQACLPNSGHSSQRQAF